MKKALFTIIFGVFVFIVFKLLLGIANTSCLALLPKCLEKPFVANVIISLDKVLFIWLPLVTFGFYKYINEHKK